MADIARIFRPYFIVGLLVFGIQTTPVGAVMQYFGGPLYVGLILNICMIHFTIRGLQSRSNRHLLFVPLAVYGPYCAVAMAASLQAATLNRTLHKQNDASAFDANGTLPILVDNPHVARALAKYFKADAVFYPWNNTTLLLSPGDCANRGPKFSEPYVWYTVSRGKCLVSTKRDFDATQYYEVKKTTTAQFWHLNYLTLTTYTITEVGGDGAFQPRQIRGGNATRPSYFPWLILGYFFPDHGSPSYVLRTLTTTLPIGFTKTPDWYTPQGFSLLSLLDIDLRFRDYDGIALGEALKLPHRDTWKPKPFRPPPIAPHKSNPG